MKARQLLRHSSVPLELRLNLRVPPGHPRPLVLLRQAHPCCLVGGVGRPTSCPAHLGPKPPNFGHGTLTPKQTTSLANGPRPSKASIRAPTSLSLTGFARRSFCTLANVPLAFSSTRRNRVLSRAPAGLLPKPPRPLLTSAPDSRPFSKPQGHRWSRTSADEARNMCTTCEKCRLVNYSAN